MKLPTDRTVFQNAWVVPDLDAAVKKWVDEMKVGPFFFAEHGPNLTEMTYRGQPSELSMNVALAQAGGVQIELIEPTTDKPCAYRDTVKEGQSGFHHMCVWTHDIDADTKYFAGLGYEAANLGRANMSRFGYYDTTPLMNCMIEVLEYNPATEAMFQKIADAAKDWDGTNPVRDFASLLS